MRKTNQGVEVFKIDAMIFNNLILIIITGIACSMIGCASQEDKPDHLFTEINSTHSGINFANQLTFDEEFNIYTYRNFYNGGGVGLGDINNDGLIDVYLTGNMVRNKLFINKGNFVFEDITEKAGVAGSKAWSTGVSMADVNGDGLIDIYVCNSGDIKGDNKQNELFINNGDLTFSERGEEYGIADHGYTTHAAFFDYDKDGDLDLYVLNNSYQAIGSFNLRKNERPKRDSLGGDKLMRNDGGKFVDVSEEAGIYGSVIGFGLGVTVGDVDKDGWLDIYVSNDFFERDYLYINKHDGTFKECLTEQLNSISGASMGADLADINNDSYPDIFVTEMLPKENSRMKTVTTFENWDRYQYNLENDYYHQFTRNMLQLNNGDNSFSEIGRLSGVEATDWSWGALIFDMDNDGLKDIFVSNGIFQDLTNQDYLQYVSNDEIVKAMTAGNKVDFKSLIETIPSNPISNFAFHNQGNFQFENKADEWGLGKPIFSNGSAYGDLDNDGDLDLIVSNVNSEVSVYRNETNTENAHYLKFILKGNDKNTSAFGAKITITKDNKEFYVEQMPIRGFESSMDPRPNIGLGDIDTVDAITIEWPDGTGNLLFDVPTNQTIHFDEKDGVVLSSLKIQRPKKITTPTIFQSENTSPDFVHNKDQFVDFDRDYLVYHMTSTEGPHVSKGDVNGDGREDFYIGGAKDQPGALFVQTASGSFAKTNRKIFEQDRASIDMRSVMFDTDGDGDLDLYVCSGGNEYPNTSTALIDRLYINNGKGLFTKSSQTLPTFRFESTSTVQPGDYDGDGDLDLFVGVRIQTFAYGAPMNGYILSNDGKGNFTEVTKTVAPQLLNIGMITDAVWSDVDGDHDQDLVVVGEYMPIKVFINDNGKLSDRTDDMGLSKTNGWWNRIEAADLDNDGDLDFVVGNHGLNSRFKASQTKPVCMYVNDFDQNGTVEQIICTYNGDKSYPLALRHDLVSHIPMLKKKYLKYENYKDQTVQDIFTPEQLKDAIKLDAYELASVVLINEGGKLVVKELPAQAQMSPVYAIAINDFNKDGIPDIVLGGNLYGVKPEVGRYDASFGVLLTGKGDGSYTETNTNISGLHMDGEVRDMLLMKSAGKNHLFIARNGNSILTYTYDN